MLRKISAAFLTIALVFTFAPLKQAFSQDEQESEAEAWARYSGQAPPQDEAQGVEASEEQGAGREAQGVETSEAHGDAQNQPQSYNQDQPQEEPKPQEPEVKAKYIGTPDSMRYHYPYCPYVRQAREASRVKFKSAKEAQRAGYMACNLCTPLITE